MISWVIGLLAISHAAKAQEIKVQAIALFNGKAMLSVNGGRAKVIEAGSSFQKVKLLESSTTQAIIEFSGQQQTLTLDGTTFLSQSLAKGPVSDGNGRATLYSDNSGFFRSQGQVNGRPLSFIVDTGANLVVLSGQQADSIGIDYKDGALSYAITASGETPMYLITLDKISFQGISLNFVKAGVIEGAFPRTPLLGMSFLEKLEMSRTGDTMVLKKR